MEGSQLSVSLKYLFLGSLALGYVFHNHDEPGWLAGFVPHKSGAQLYVGLLRILCQERVLHVPAVALVESLSERFDHLGMVFLGHEFKDASTQQFLSATVPMQEQRGLVQLRHEDLEVSDDDAVGDGLEHGPQFPL